MRERKSKFQHAGLGRSKIKFLANNDATAFKSKLENVIPKLILLLWLSIVKEGLIRQQLKGNLSTSKCMQF